MSSVLSALTVAFAALGAVNACDNCYGPSNPLAHNRIVRRMQPDAQGATTGPRGPLAWGQINFLHTTDTHGWLEGHLGEENYGADWGDFVSFTKHMKEKAKHLGVDLLLVDTGDLHDGAGLSDATSLNGELTLPIFDNVDYDLLTIGNHELYVTEIAYETFSNFSTVYGDKYLTSNVQILNPNTNQFEYIGKKYRYFTTPLGHRIMAFGVLFDFTGNSNVSKVIKAADLVQQDWFINAVNYPKPIDLFVLIGHNPVNFNSSSSSLDTVFAAIRSLRPDVPIQGFGGHTHIRDFKVWDEAATGLESGRYCETLGWLSMTGFDAPKYKGTKTPHGVPHPSQPAISVHTNSSAKVTVKPLHHHTSSRLPKPKYFRRYLDWNRRTFAYHAVGSQNKIAKLDTKKGVAITSEINSTRGDLDLKAVYGCAPATYCISCKPFGDSGNIFSLLSTALSATVVNATRADKARIIIINTGSIRFDLVQGPFTYDDSFIVSPFDDRFQYIKDVPYSQASQVIGILNAGAYQKRETISDWRSETFSDTFFGKRESCLDPPITHSHNQIQRRSSPYLTRGEHRIPRASKEVPGYVTVDDFSLTGEGDDTAHSAIPSYAQPNDLQASAGFPADGSDPDTVDVVFLDFIGALYVIPALNKVGGNYSVSDIDYYMPLNFSSNSYLPAYAQQFWQANIDDCPVGQGVGF